MNKKFYIADWHFDHANVLHFDNRPFPNVEAMNQELISRWNQAVGTGDLVYVLGDMFWCKADKSIEILKRLNGTKILVKGNHDRVGNSDFDKQFAKITDYLEVKDEDRYVVLSHYPMPCYKNHYHGWYHLYGHVHNSFEWNIIEHDRYLMTELYEKPCAMYNVGAMMPWMDYTPRTLDEIISSR